MESLECNACSYKFKSKGMPRRCPYCSAEGKVSYAKTAQDFLDDTFSELSAMDKERERRS